MRTAIAIIVGLLITGLTIFLATKRPSSDKQRDLDAIYAQLKSLPVVTKDFSTPEGAILCLEDAYRHRDIEAAIAAKDFKTEARLMLHDLAAGKNLENDDEMVSHVTEDLKSTYRADTMAKWPDFNGLESFFTKREPYANKVVAVTEVCRFPDHEFSTQRLLVAETTNGWRVMNPLDK
jgi:hypothetical protein